MQKRGWYERGRNQEEKGRPTSIVWIRKNLVVEIKFEQSLWQQIRFRHVIDVGSSIQCSEIVLTKGRIDRVCLGEIARDKHRLGAFLTRLQETINVSIQMSVIIRVAFQVNEFDHSVMVELE